MSKLVKRNKPVEGDLILTPGKLIPLRQPKVTVRFGSDIADGVTVFSKEIEVKSFKINNRKKLPE